jgi:NAD(P)-dependent dehydrogenase (short-subunit alcohol dehydrogenase family)
MPPASASICWSTTPPRSGRAPSRRWPASRLAKVAHVYAVNVVAPLALIQLALPLIPAGGAIVNVTSDAAVEPYEGWGAYGSSKAALEQLTAILAAEQPQLCVYAVDPGDMRTRMHQAAFPGEDISDRPPPEDSVPGLLALLDGALPSGRYEARGVLAGAGAGAGAAS